MGCVALAFSMPEKRVGMVLEYPKDAVSIVDFKDQCGRGEFRGYLKRLVRRKQVA